MCNLFHGVVRCIYLQKSTIEMGRPSHARSSVLKTRSNNMENTLFSNQMGDLPGNMGLGTCLNEHGSMNSMQQSLQQCAIYFTELCIESICRKTPNRNGPSISWQLSSENAFKHVQTTWKTFCSATKCATCLATMATWFWKPFSTKYGIYSKRYRGRSALTGPARRMIRKTTKDIVSICEHFSCGTVDSARGSVSQHILFGVMSGKGSKKLAPSLLPRKNTTVTKLYKIEAL